MKKVKKNTLVDLNIFDVALVDKGANKKKRFFNVIKSHGGYSMNKKQALILMKSDSLSKEDKDELLESLEENVKADVLASIKKDEDGEAKEESKEEESKEEEKEESSDEESKEEEKEDKAEESDVEKAGSSISKKNKAKIEGVIKALEDILNFGHTEEEEKPKKTKKSEEAEDDLIDISPEEVKKMVQEEINKLQV